MRKTRTRFEQVPVAVVEKILEQQSSLAKPDGNHKIVIVKSKRAARPPSTLSKNVEVLIPS
jgi:hypothetical protein